MQRFYHFFTAASLCTLALGACGDPDQVGSQSASGGGASVAPLPDEVDAQSKDEQPDHSQIELKGDWVGTMTFESADGEPQEAAFALRADEEGLVYEIRDAAGNVWNLDNAEAQTHVLSTGAVLIAMSQPGEQPQTIQLEGFFDATASQIEGAMFVQADELPQGIEPHPYAEFGDDALEPPYQDAGDPAGEADAEAKAQPRAPELLVLSADEEPWFDPGPQQDDEDLPSDEDAERYGNLEDDLRDSDLPDLVEAQFLLTRVDEETYADGEQVDGEWKGRFISAEGVSVELELHSNAFGDLEAGQIGGSSVEPLDYHPGALGTQPWQPGVIDAPELMDDDEAIEVHYLVLDDDGTVMTGPADHSLLGEGQIVLKKQEGEADSL